MKLTRAKQRFENFKKSFVLLEEAINLEHPSIIEKAGAIQFFEITFELSWKVMKDYLEYLGFIVKSPRESIKLAYEYELIDKADIWLEMLGDRNITTHTYNETDADEVFERIKDEYIVLLKDFYKRMERFLD